MQMVIKNFGAIREGSINLSKNLYVFVGYNNTGKTYLTKLIYEVFNEETLSNFADSTYNHFSSQETKELELTKEIIDSILGDYSTYLQEVVVKKFLKMETNNFFSLEFKYILADVKENELKSGVQIGVGGTDIEIEIYHLRKSKDSMSVIFEHWDFDDISSQLPADFFDSVPKKHFQEHIESVKSDAPKKLVESLLKLLLQNREKPFFLPSNRMCILENAEEFKRKEEARKKEFLDILTDVLENKKDQPLTREILARKSETEYPPYIRHLINKILKLRSSKEEDFLVNGTGFYNDLLSKFSEILGGRIVFEKATSVSNYMEKLEMRNGQRIKMDLTSSSVNQLSSLFLYLKYWAKSERNFLMVDEPEENLHPENQILLINLLLKFSKNNRLLITTHSPLVAEMINNYLVFSQLNDENKADLCQELGLCDVFISPSNTAIYYFQGEFITEHKVHHYGTIFTSFKLAQDKIYTLGERLSDLMFSQLNKE